MRGAALALVLAGWAVAGCDAQLGASDASATATATSAPFTSAPSATATAQLTDQQLEAEVQAQLPKLRRDCYQPFLQKGGERVGAPLPLMLELDSSGKVVDAAAAGGGAELRELRGCIEEAARKWQLSAPGKRTELATTVAL